MPDEPMTFEEWWVSSADPGSDVIYGKEWRIELCAFFGGKPSDMERLRLVSNLLWLRGEQRQQFVDAAEMERLNREKPDA